MMRTISNYFQKNEKWLTPTALFGGFLIDNLTLRRSDLLVENILLALYFLVVLGGLVIWHKIESQKHKTVSRIELQSIIFLIIQFAFGGLFSSLTVFYVKSASLFASWPFLFLLFGGMIATEYFKKHFTQFLVQLATVYVLLFTYLIMIVPLIFKQINPTVFVVSGFISLCIIVLYILIFYKIDISLVTQKQKMIWGVIGGIFITMNLFYFLNIIPPIPLALKDSGVYQSVIKNNSNYNFVSFPEKYSFMHFKKEYQISTGTPVYFFSSIYAPVKFKQKIVHEWQKKNSEGEWQTISIISFPIYGGNDSGYRGYTISNQITKGQWRVLVKTQGGQVLGGESFIVK